jgi:hypothetical protein
MHRRMMRLYLQFMSVIVPTKQVFRNVVLLFSYLGVFVLVFETYLFSG